MKTLTLLVATIEVLLLLVATIALLAGFFRVFLAAFALIYSYQSAAFALRASNLASLTAYLASSYITFIIAYYSYYSTIS